MVDIGLIAAWKRPERDLDHNCGFVRSQLRLPHDARSASTPVWIEQASIKTNPCAVGDCGQNAERIRPAGTTVAHLNHKYEQGRATAEGAIVKKLSLIALSSLLIIALTGCATIFKGPTEDVDISSDPDRAEVYVNGVLMGRTPIALQLRSADQHVIEFRKEGYDSRTVILNGSVGVGWIILDVFTGFLPVIIDAITGDWYHLETTNVRAALESEE